VWVVVVAGDIAPMYAHGNKALWEVTSWDANTGSFLGSYWSPKDGPWPANWDTLPDRDPNRR
jgi:hypothetical protein